MSDPMPLERLAVLLATSGAEPDLHPERSAPSTIYDLEYRVIVVAMAFRLHATEDRFSPKPRIQARRLKLLQFIAMRPWLVSVISEWSKGRKDARRSLEPEESLRRGFIGDTMHDAVMDFLVAAGVLRREDAFVVAGVNSSVIFGLYDETRRREMFDTETATLVSMKDITVTNEMLEGW